MAKAMVGKLLVAILVVAALAAAAHPSSASGWAVVYNPTGHRVFLVVDGSEVYAVPPRGSVSLPAPSRVCVSSSNLTIYESVDGRLAFRGWVAGGLLVAGGRCVEAEAGGSYMLLYVVEYRVRVTSQPPGVVDETLWAGEGGLVEVTVPLRVEAGGFVYELVAWEGVVDAEGSRARVAVAGPTSVVAVYRILVRVETPAGSMLVPSGTKLSSLAARAGWDHVKRAGDGVRLVLRGFRVNATFVSLEDAGSYTITAPATVEPVYVKEYLVVVRTPAAAQTQWVPEGSPVQLAAPASIDVNETVKLSFVGWRTPNGTLITVPTAVVNATQPGAYEALYNALYKVEIRAPFGSSTLWARGGNLLPLTQPVRLPGVVYDRVLVYYIVNGRVVEPGEDGLLLLTVRQPTTIVAVYTVKANIMHLAVIAAFLLSIAAAYIAYNVFQAAGRAATREDAETGEEYGTSG